MQYNKKKITNVVRKLIQKYTDFRQTVSHRIVLINQKDLFLPLKEDCHRITEFCADFLLQRINLYEFVRALGHTYFASELTHIVPYLRVTKNSKVIIEILKVFERFHLDDARDQLLRRFEGKLQQPEEVRSTISRKHRPLRQYHTPKYLKNYILF